MQFAISGEVDIGKGAQCIHAFIFDAAVIKLLLVNDCLVKYKYFVGYTSHIR